MSEPRKKPGVAFWATVVVVVVLVAYPLSFGPACWIAQREVLARAHVARVYSPFVVAATDGPEIIQRPLTAYVELFAPSDEVAVLVFSYGVISTEMIKTRVLDMLRAETR